MSHSGRDAELSTRTRLALAYRVIAMWGLDDSTYTHLSAREPGADHYYIYRFGQLFEEVTPDNLLKVSLDGTVLDSSSNEDDDPAVYNKTGYIIHGSIYSARPDINSIFHLHTPASVAVCILLDTILLCIVC